MLTFTIDTRAPSERAFNILCTHSIHTSSGEDVTRMNETVQCFSRDFDHFLLPVIQLTFGDVDIEDSVECIVVVCNL